MRICCIMATCGRHTLAERSLKFFLDQDYKDKHTLLIFNNSEFNFENPLRLEPTEEDISRWNTKLLTVMVGRMDSTAYSEHKGEPNPLVILVNQCIDTKTRERYKTLGAIYNDALKYVPEDTDVIVHWDDDDIFLPNHISEGVKGLEKAIEAGKKAYKPAKSWYRHPNGIELMSNTLEPSIFVLADHLKKYKYGLSTTDQHLTWVDPLVYSNEILVDEGGVPTLIYNWGDVGIPTFKTSGNATHPQNFQNYRNFSQDHGDRILTPWSSDRVEEYYNLVKDAK